MPHLRRHSPNRWSSGAAKAVYDAAPNWFVAPNHGFETRRQRWDHSVCERNPG